MLLGMDEFCHGDSEMRQALFAVVAGTAMAATAVAQSPLAVAPLGPNNGLSAAGSSVYFDLVNLAATPLTITSLDYFASSALGTATEIEVFLIEGGTFVGNSTNAALWTSIGSGLGVSNGTTTLAPIDIPDFTIPVGGMTAVALVVRAGGIRYRGATGVPPTSFENADLRFNGGLAQSTPFGGTQFNPRIFSGNIYYIPAPGALALLGVAGLAAMRRRR